MVGTEYPKQFCYSPKKPSSSWLEHGISTIDYRRKTIEEDISSLRINDDFLIGIYEPRVEVIWILEVTKPVNILDISTLEKLENLYQKGLFKYTGETWKMKYQLYKEIKFDTDKIRSMYDGFYIDLSILNNFLQSKLLFYKRDWKGTISGKGTVWLNWVFDEPVYDQVTVHDNEEEFGFNGVTSYSEELVPNEKQQDNRTQNISVEFLKNKAEKGKKHPQKVTSKSESYIRNSHVSLFAKKKANGICQLCEQPAPFKDKEGNPYLENHHIKWLSQGGLDTIENTVALCPNCHRKMHILDLKEDVEKLMKIAKR